MDGPFGPTSYALGNGLSAYMSYDALGRLNGKWICNGPTPAQNCSGSSVAYSFTTNWQGQRLLSSTDSVLASGVYNYDDFNRLVLTNYNNGGYEFSEVYDRYGNRWQQNMIAGGGTEPQLSFNASNQMVGYSYDAAGNVANDGFHTYTWDAENNLLSTDNGQTDSYVRDALGRLVRANVPTNNNQQIEYFWSPSGQWDSEWNAANGSQWQGTYFWGSTPVAFYYADGKTHFEHQDWVNTERMRTSYSGKIEATVDSLPFGDGMTVHGAWYDPPYHAFGYDYDSASNTYHVGARQYSPTQGRWLSPDPYDGSYDFSNPQTFNRYAYALNNPLAFTDPTGMDCQDGVGMDLGQGGGDEDPCEGYDGPSDPDTGGYPGSGIAATWGPCPDGSGSSCLNGDHDGEVNCASSGGCLQWSSQCQCWGAMQTPAPPTTDPSGPWWLPLGTTANGPVYGGQTNGPGGGGGASSRTSLLDQWPLNGNILLYTARQDQKCSVPLVGPSMDSNPAILSCCQAHDNCYAQHNCNATSWLPGGFDLGVCKACNAAVVACIGGSLAK